MDYKTLLKMFGLSDGPILGPSIPSRMQLPQHVQQRGIEKARQKRAKRAARNLAVKSLQSTTSQQGEEKAI